MRHRAFLCSLPKSALDADNRWLRLRFQPFPLFLSASILLLWIFATACTPSPPKPRPLTAEEQRGRELFETNCAICHNAFKNEPLQGPPMVGVFRKQALPSGMPATDQHVRDTIVTGRRNMPPFNGILDDQQVNELIAFLHTL